VKSAFPSPTRYGILSSWNAARSSVFFGIQKNASTSIARIGRRRVRPRSIVVARSISRGNAATTDDRSILSDRSMPSSIRGRRATRSTRAARSRPGLRRNPHRRLLRPLAEIQPAHHVALRGNPDRFAHLLAQVVPLNRDAEVRVRLQPVRPFGFPVVAVRTVVRRLPCFPALWHRSHASRWQTNANHASLSISPVEHLDASSRDAASRSTRGRSRCS
jgi:hypothetical protein